MSDLDDFFAKKSRKKKTKNTSAVLAGDLLNQKKEQEVRKQKKLKDKDDKSNEPLSSLLKKTMEDDEWNDMETEKEPTAADLSRIQNLTISRETEQIRDGEDRNNRNTTGPENEDNAREESEKQGAAWGVSGGEAPNGTGSDNESGVSEEASAPAEEEPTPGSAKEPAADAEEKTEEDNSKGASAAPKAYIAPHLRNRPASQTTEYSSTRKFQPKAKAPDIGNVEEFPTLGGKPRDTQGAADGSGGKGFTRVQHGGLTAGNTRSAYSRGMRSDGGKGRGGESLTLENRYATLSDDC